MNWQQLVARLKQETTRGGPPPASPDSSARDDLSLWNWISDAWISLQTDGKNWRFARTTCSFSTTATVADYDYADMGLDGNFQRLWPCNDYYRPRAANASTNWALSRELSYDEFGATFLPGTAAGAPRAYTVTPDRKLRIGPTPDAAYTITIDVVRPVQRFAGPGDEPTGLPEEHQLVLVWEALKHAAIDDAAPELLAKANDKHKADYARLFLQEGDGFGLHRRSL